MFLSNEEKIEIDTTKDYVVLKPKIGFYESLVNSDNFLVILSLFSRRCEELFNILSTKWICQLHQNSTKNAKILITTPGKFIGQNVPKPSFLVLDESHLFIPFGYSSTLAEIRSMGFSLIAMSEKILSYNFLKEPIIISSKRCCFVKAENEQKYMVLFSIIKFNIFNDDFIVLTRDEFTKNKVSLFLKVFGYSRFNEVYLVQENISTCRAIVFSDEDLRLDLIEAIYLSSTIIKNLKEMSFDYTKVDDFAYKIKDVLRVLSPSICKKQKTLAPERFANLKHILRDIY